MDPRCVAIHPSRHPLPLHPPAPSPCVQCAVTTVTNAKAIYTLRRSACTTLTSLSRDPANLHRLGTSFLSDTLEHLLHSLLILEYQQCELAEEISSVCVYIACHSDGFTTNASEHKLSALLFSECVAAIMLKDCTLNSMKSISVLASLCEVCKVQNIALSFESLPTDFALHMLSHCKTPKTSPPAKSMLSETSYSSLNVLLKFVLNGVHLSSSKELLQATVASLPPCRDSDADQMFLTVVSHLVETVPEVVFDCAHFPIVLKAGFMSSVEGLRRTSASIVFKISDAPNYMEKLERLALLEYIVESLRISDPSSIQLPLLRYSLCALSCFSSSQFSERWVYSLDVILLVAPHLGAYIHELELPVCAALREAPLPLFSCELIEAVVSFIMQMLVHKKDVTNLIESITSLFERIRPGMSHLQAILPILESTAGSACYMNCVAMLISIAGRHFKNLTMQLNEEEVIDDIALLGRRFSVIVFEVWARTHRKSLAKMCSFEANMALYALNGVRRVVDALTSVLDRCFMLVGAYSWPYFHKMVSWCWQTLPPKAMFSYCSRADKHDRILTSVAEYCLSISLRENVEECVSETRVPVTEQMLLNDLAAGSEALTLLKAHQLLQQALDLNMLQNLCPPELVIQALHQRFNYNFSHPSISKESRPADVLRLISRICICYGTRFPQLELSEPVLVFTMGNMDFSFSSETDCLLFHFMTRQGGSAASVKAWERFADFFRTSSASPEASSHIVENIFSDDDTLASAVHAISKATNPVAIAECLVYFLEKKLVTHAALGNALQSAGFIEKSCLSLRDIESAIGLDKVQTTTYRNIRTGTGILILLAGASCLSDSSCWRKLSRAVCDLFVCAETRKERTAFVDQLLTASLSYFSRILPFLTKGNTPTLRYIWQSGVVDSGVRILHTLSGDCDISSLLASATCCFLDRALHGLQEKVQNNRHNAISEGLRRFVLWDRLLSSFPSSVDVTDARRIEQGCRLLRNIHSAKATNNLKFDKLGSHRVTVALGVASCSVFTGLRDAALNLLGQMMKIDSTAVTWQTGLTIHREISHSLLQKLGSKTTDALNAAELSYFQEAVRSGHLNKPSLH